MTHLHVTLSAHLDLRVEVVVPVSHPRVSSTYASEMGQGNETGSRKNMRNRPQLTVAAPLLSASTQYLFRLLPLLSRSPFGREARGHRHRVISPSASADAVRYCCCRSLRRRRDGISADARPEKHDGCVDQAPACRARRLVRAGWSAIESPCHRRRSGRTRRRTRGAARANVFCFLRLTMRSSWRRSPPL